ncbi:MAG: membrane integrity-associated transporter subunit PqiC [Candidatus Binatia bacterium]
MSMTRALCLLLAAAAVTGCSLLRGPTETPTRFYVLTGTVAPAPARSPLAIGLGPIAFPAYLERPEFASRVETNEFAYSQTARWAEPLKQNFTRVLAADLVGLLGTQRVLIYPWYRSLTPDYAIAIDVTRFEPQPGGQVALTARWVVTGSDRQLVASEVAELTQRGGPPEQTAAAMSALIGDLAQQIAASIPAR